MKKKSIVVLLLSLGVLTACQTTSGRQQSSKNSEFSCVAGTIGGAVIGGMLGSTIGRGGGRVAATAVGMGAGGSVGNRMGCD